MLQIKEGLTIMIAHGKKIKIFTGNSHPELAKEIADLLGLPLGNAKVSTFSDGEISVDINETVRGVDVFIVQSTSSPVNNNLMELLKKGVDQAYVSKHSAILTINYYLRHFLFYPDTSSAAETKKTQRNVRQFKSGG